MLLTFLEMIVRFISSTSIIDAVRIQYMRLIRQPSPIRLDLGLVWFWLVGIASWARIAAHSLTMTIRRWCIVYR